MVRERTKSLWGQDFRVVNDGLEESDVATFVDRLMSQHLETREQLDHLDALRDLAKKSVEEAEHLASSMREEAKRESEAASARILAEAKARAREILKKPKRLASLHEVAVRSSIAAIETDYRKKALDRMARIESALLSLKESAIKELSTRMRSHYIGKHLYQSVHFIPAFEKLIKEVEDELVKGPEDAAPVNEAGSSAAIFFPEEEIAS